jgi:uncharacterized membrane protein
MTSPTPIQAAAFRGDWRRVLNLTELGCHLWQIKRYTDTAGFLLSPDVLYWLCTAAGVAVDDVLDRVAAAIANGNPAGPNQPPTSNVIQEGTSR